MHKQIGLRMFDSLLKRHFKRIRSQQGFTLVEALINVAIATIVVVGAHTAYIHAMKSARSQESNITSKTLVGQIISAAVGSGTRVPPMSSSTGFLTYVGCYTRDGLPVKNTLGVMGMVMVTKKLDNNPSGYCEAGMQLEARVFKKTGKRMTVQVWEKNPSSGKGSFVLITEREFDPPEDL